MYKTYVELLFLYFLFWNFLNMVQTESLQSTLKIVCDNLCYFIKPKILFATHFFS